MSADEKIWGRRAIIEAFSGGRRKVKKIIVARGLHGSTFQEIEELARRKGIKIELVDRKRLDGVAGTSEHQGVVAVVTSLETENVSTLLGIAAERKEPPFFVVLDQITDPQNLGAILRTADAAGVHGAIMADRNTAPLHGATAKASAGAVEHLPVARVSNLGQALARLGEAGVRIVATESAETSREFFAADLKGPLAIVFGSEGKGISGPVRSRCSESIHIPMLGKVDSLNVSASAAVVLYEAVRQRRIPAGS